MFKITYCLLCVKRHLAVADKYPFKSNTTVKNWKLSNVEWPTKITCSVTENNLSTWLGIFHADEYLLNNKKYPVPMNNYLFNNEKYPVQTDNYLFSNRKYPAQMNTYLLNDRKYPVKMYKNTILLVN
jgi:hypothetical protein